MNLADIKKIIETFNDSEITKLKVKEGEFELKLQKGGVSQSFTPQILPSTTIQAQIPQGTQIQAPESAPATPAPIVCADTGCYITSPMVGTFYKSPSPGASAYVNVGDIIKKGQTVGIVEAMKIMNEIEADFDCKIVSIEVADGSPVEFSTNLIKVEKI